jgi:hypothetical protein
MYHFKFKVFDKNDLIDGIGKSEFLQHFQTVFSNMLRNFRLKLFCIIIAKFYSFNVVR